MDKAVSHPFLVASSVSVSGSSSTFTSSVSSVLYRDTFAYQVNYAGNPFGTININGSLDYNPGGPQNGGAAGGGVNAGSWATLTSLAVSSATAQPIIMVGNQQGVAWTQFQFISATSSGTMAVYTAAKSLG